MAPARKALGTFGVPPRRAPFDREIQRAPGLLIGLEALAAFESAAGAWPSYATLGRATGCTASAAWKRLRRLEALGYVRRVGKRGRSTVWRIIGDREAGFVDAAGVWVVPPEEIGTFPPGGNRDVSP